MRKIVFIEFNELCPSLIANWMDEGRLPNFKTFYDDSDVFTAQADVTDPRYLEPWIQWYSLHTGLSYEQHGVFHLTDGPTASHKDIWHFLLDNGYTVGNCAGMNSPGISSPGSFYLPDPWCNSEAPYPEELMAYQRVVLTKVQENSNAPGSSLSKKDYLDFVRFLTSHGLRTKSAAAVVQQLLEETLKKGGGWKRAALLDKLQFDIFKHYWSKLKLDYASFFLNSTAHYQHAYWHLLQPENFSLPPESMDDREHREAILFGYQQMDKLLGDFFHMEAQGAMLILSTALSQQPNPQAGNVYYRPRNAEKLLSALDIHPVRLLPVMAHQYSAIFPDRESATRARERLADVKYRGESLFEFPEAPANTIFFGNMVHESVPKDAMVEFAAPLPRTESFYEVFYRIPHTKSGAHHPESVLWFKSGRHRVHPENISILDILPTLLDYYGVKMTDEDGLHRTGRSLDPVLNLGHYRKTMSAAAS